MMATLAESAQYAEDPAFIRRVRQAMTKAAQNVASESDQTANHTDRVKLASTVLALPNEWAQNFAIGCANNGNVGTGTSDPLVDDGALEFVVASLWDAFSG
jgi:hypothetical protein